MTTQEIDKLVTDWRAATAQHLVPQAIINAGNGLADALQSAQRTIEGLMAETAGLKQGVENANSHADRQRVTVVRLQALVDKAETVLGPFAADFEEAKKLYKRMAWNKRDDDEVFDGCDVTWGQFSAAAALLAEIEGEKT